MSYTKLFHPKLISYQDTILPTVRWAIMRIVWHSCNRRTNFQIWQTPCSCLPPSGGNMQLCIIIKQLSQSLSSFTSHSRQLYGKKLCSVLSRMSKKLELLRRKNITVFSTFSLDIPDIIQITTKEMSTFPLLHVNFCWKGKFWIMVQYVYVEYIR